MDVKTIGLWLLGTGRRRILTRLALLLLVAMAGCGENEEKARLDAKSIPQFVEPLLIPPVMEPFVAGGPGNATEYRIAARQFDQQLLPQSLPSTTVWGYGRLGDPLPGSSASSSFSSPAFTIETRRGERVRVLWVNQLVEDPSGSTRRFLPHLLPVDQTLFWANPQQDSDSHGTSPNPYTGPVPIVTHLHGGHVPSISDGLPDAWFLPDATNLPSGTNLFGSHYGTVAPAPAGAAWFEYPLDQRASTLWYHDHALGLTRLNVYAGLAGFWIHRDRDEDALNLPGPAPRRGDPAGTRYYEIPVAIQDRSFYDDGSLFYPDSREFFDGYSGPYAPQSKVPPIWNPEFFGDTIIVNGKTWPYLDVEARPYRFRLLNGCNSRFLVLKLDPSLSFHQIGSEGGLLPDAQVPLEQILLGPAERADVVVDFSGLSPGARVRLLNLGPDSPFGGFPIEPEDLADAETTGRVMELRVVARTSQGNIGGVPRSLPSIARLQTALPARDLTLNEEMDPAADIPIEADLGTAADGPLGFDEAITETLLSGDTEIWRLTNLTGDAHPIHLHLVMFQVLDRTPIDAEAFSAAQRRYLSRGKIGSAPDPSAFTTGPPEAPAANERGWKDTVVTLPEQITRIIAKFDMAGLYLWHCHILEHEDNEMMRPYMVQPRP